MKHLHLIIAGGAAAMLWHPALALATPTQEEVFRSINENVGSTIDIDKFLPFLFAIIAIAIMVGLYVQRKKRPVVPKSMNHPSRLIRHAARSLGLRPAEVRQLRLLAGEQQIVNPLTLLLCPSVLAKSLRNRSPEIDAATLAAVIHRMRKPAPEPIPEEAAETVVHQADAGPPPG